MMPLASFFTKWQGTPRWWVIRLVNRCAAIS